MATINETTCDVTITVPITVPAARLFAVLVNAYETSGYAGWMGVYQYVGMRDALEAQFTPDDLALFDRLNGAPNTDPAKRRRLCHSEVFALALVTGRFGIPIADEEDDCNTYLGMLTREKVIMNGLPLMAAQFPARFSELLNEDDDAETADVLLQLSLFGELVYG